jgi:3-deoxy-D-manno-octulosonate 8-phosphate phosphatase (KDO 8-P phosphatase)
VTRILFLDVDGTLTDGGILLGRGEDIRRFHARDGVGIRLAALAGIEVIFLTARECRAVERRARELGARCVMGAARKQEHVARLCAEAGVRPAEAAFVGDDLQDIPAMRAVGRAIAVADAVAEVKEVCQHVTETRGGQGAVREAVEWLLRQEGRWQATLGAFLESCDFVVRDDPPGPEAR